MMLRVVAGGVAGLVIAAAGCTARALQDEHVVAPIESRIAVGNASLYSRAVGTGPPIIVLHGGPGFDHSYLLPDLDEFQDTFRLIYYDQRGRGRSAEGVRPEDVTLESEVHDLDRVREHYGQESAILLGHSWGAVLALEYALRNPGRVSHLILMNPAPLSAADVALWRETYLEALGADMAQQREILSSAAYKEGDPEAVTARHRIHFKRALRRTEDYERLMAAMSAAFARQGKEGIVKARAIGDRLIRDTWDVEGYDLLPELHGLRIPTLVIVGEDDFIPVPIARHIAEAIPNARLVKIEECGHFAYMECAREVREAFDDFLPD